MAGLLAVSLAVALSLWCSAPPASVDLGTWEPAGDSAPGEVRGLRVIPGERSLTVEFLDAPRADTYRVCWSDRGEPAEGECTAGVNASPYEIAGLDEGVTYKVTAHGENAHGDGAIARVAQGTPGSADRPLEIRATMDARDLRELYARDVRSDDRLPADVVVADPSTGKEAALEAVRGIRFRGNFARRLDRKSYHIRLDRRPVPQKVGGPLHDFNFRSPYRRAGDRILLVETYTDPSGIRAALSFAMYEELGLPAPATYFADWWLNGTYEGHYVAIERVDREALRGWGLNRRRGEHTLVRDRTVQMEEDESPDPEATSVFELGPDGLGEDDDERVRTLKALFDYRGERGDHDWEGLLDLVRWTDETDAGPDFERGLKERFDVDALVDVLALMEMQNDYDSFKDDYWLYRDEAGDGLWRIIPWDQDLTLGAGWPVEEDYFSYHVTARDALAEYWENPFFEKTIDTLEGRIHDRIESLYNDVFTGDWLEAELSALLGEVKASLMRPPEPAFSVHPAQNLPGSAGLLAYHAEAVRLFWELRRERLLADSRNSRQGGQFEGTVVLNDDGVGWATDAEGWVLARFRGEPGEALDLRIDLLENATLDGVQREWLVEPDAGAWSGEISLYYKNDYETTWLPEQEVAGRNWELTMVQDDGDGGTWLPTRVNPFANGVTAEVHLEGQERFALLYRE